MQVRRGVTLLELLVVVAILAILAALLAVGLSGSRESARRAQCTNQQHNLALALANFESAKTHFPGYRNLMAKNARGAPRPTGWVFPLLPFVEQEAVHDAHGPHGAVASRGTVPSLSLPGLKCPSDPGVEARSQYLDDPPASYVVNAGQADAQRTDTFFGDVLANGVFQDSFPFDARGLAQRVNRMTTAYIQSGDGLSNTLMLSENLDSGGWPDDQEWQVGFVWEPTLVNGAPAPITLLRINERPEATTASNERESISSGPLLAWWCPACGGRGRPRPPPPKRDQDVPVVQAPGATSGGSPANYRYARPSSQHPGGVIATFADGRSQFISEDIDYVVYAQLMTSHGQKAANIADEMRPAPDPYRNNVAADRGQ